jgi:hypothetical protein
VSFTGITLCVDSQRVFIVVRVYFVIDSVHTHSYARMSIVLMAGLLGVVGWGQT